MKTCSEPGCPTLTERGYCPKHVKPREWRRWSQRQKTTARGYGAAHQRWRTAVLSRNPVCVDCLAEGRATPATDADHIDGNPFNRSLTNGRGLCRKCHMRRTHGRDRERATGDVDRTGTEWTFA